MNGAGTSSRSERIFPGWTVAFGFSVGAQSGSGSAVFDDNSSFSGSTGSTGAGSAGNGSGANAGPGAGAGAAGGVVVVVGAAGVTGPGGVGSSCRADGACGVGAGDRVVDGCAGSAGVDGLVVAAPDDVDGDGVGVVVGGCA